MPNRTRPEIVAPAGGPEAMRAAVRSGADAVYFGLETHNARARAKNFELAALDAIMRELHASGVRGYVALNTLVFDAELDSIETAIRGCWNAGVDAVIVQDLGVLRLVRSIAPSLRVHASTQMTCTDASGVELTRSLGASRAIVARELSLSEIGEIVAATTAEIEVFVHGAMCIAYSGQCLTSEAIGGRSANRGACAQACRLPYELVVDGKVVDLGDRSYLLSPKDLEASALVPELARLGVSALKIEGRLKSPEYVAAVTSLVRRALDSIATDGDRHAAEQTFSRGSNCGFLRGVDHQNAVDGRTCDHLGIAVGTTSEPRIARGRTWLGVRLSESLARGDGILVEAAKDEPELGGRVWEILVRGEDVLGARSGDEAHVWLGPTHDGAVSSKGRRVFKTSDPANQRAILEKVERDPVRVPVDMTFRGRIGEPFELQARSERGHVARVKGDACLEVARQAPLTPQAIRDKLAKLGDTPFVLGELDLDIPDGIIFPISSLNRARRALAEALIASVHADREPAATSNTPAPRAPPGDPPAGGLFVLCRNEAQALAAADSGATGVVLDFPALTGTGDTVRTLRARYPSVFVTLTPPRIRKPGEEKIDRYLCGLAPDGLLVRSLGALAEARDACDGIGRIGDYSLNVANVHSVAEVLSAGLLAFTPAFDLDTNQLTDLCASEFGPWAEVVVHHPTPLFHMEHCIFAALLSTGHDHRTCGRPCEKHSVNLRDRRGMHHPLEADVGCRNTVFHAAAQSAASVVPTLVASGVRRFRIEVVRETAADVAMLVQSYGALIENRKSPAEVMHDVKASHGLVSGSLRVVL